MMIKKVFLFFCCVVAIELSAQTPGIDSAMDSIAQNEKYWEDWRNDLYEMGVELTKDSIKINDEARRIIADSAYSKIIYPPQYTWEVAQYLLKKMKYKPGFWYMINLYATDTIYKEPIIEVLINIDQMMDMEKILTSTFHSYAILDPSVCKIVNNKPVITRPDIVESKLNKLKEMIYYIKYYREQRKKG